MKISTTSVLLLFTFYIHAVGIYLFVRGFLLSRLSLSNVSTCNPTELCTLPPTHRRAVFIIIDALRFDFVSPVYPEPKSPYHHGILTLPAELTAAHPEQSFIYLAYSDPPTTTLQRIKGITTGSLPTFIEMGSNFGGSEIEEDSIIRQLRRSSKRIAFMGDDTWKAVFSESFESNMSHPFDSFNVEDLHTVDNGVIANIFPLLRSEHKNDWDFLIGHFLGVDHVGHRLGPTHPTMKSKLTQMDEVLKRVVDALDDDTLLVVLGDHGMDLKGDHGGDSIHETSSALWIYSKGLPLSTALSASSVIPESLLTESLYPGMPKPHRSVAQIDLIPTLSLLLGLPIPFNNLGTVIPELFVRDEDKSLLSKALRLNVEQIERYLQAYRSSPSGGELSPYWTGLEKSFHDAVKDAKAVEYTRQVLETCRTLWAQFDSNLMVLGLSILLGSIVWTVVVIFLLSDVSSPGLDWDAKLQNVASKGTRGGIVGVVLGVLIGLASPIFSGPGLVYCILWCSSAGIIFTAFFERFHILRPSFSYSLILLILHTISFFSNSFVFWEDKIVPFLLVSSIAPHLLQGIAAPERRTRYRIIGFSLFCMVCVRLMSISTVCREEQQPYCHVTFYASSTVAAPPVVMIACALVSALLLPSGMRRFLRISKSDKGPVVLFLEFLLRFGLVGGAICWVLEYCEATSVFGEGTMITSLLRESRTMIARAVYIGSSIVGMYFWFRSGLCLELVQIKEGKKQVHVFGFANSFGASYLLFLSLVFSIVWASTQLTGQVILALGMVTLLSWLEVVDSLRDVTLLKKKFDSSSASNSGQTLKGTSVKLYEVMPIALLGLQMFYGTGHQSTLPSIQWRSAFILTSKLVYPFSPALVIINSFGPLLLAALSAPLVGMWNTEPLPHPSQSSLVQRNVLTSVKYVTVYYTCLLVGSAASAAWLRRHLMVWKVFAPRFMAAAAGLVAVDVGVAMAMFLGVPGVMAKISKTFGKREKKED